VRAAALVAFCALAVAGCGGGGGGGEAAGTATTPRVGGPSPEATAIRNWITVLNAGNPDQAADFFAPGAIVVQGRTARLSTHADAVAFNRSLPCKATVTDIEDEGATVIAAFKLRPGPGSPASCGGNGVRVRFKFRGGKFSEWRQIPQSAGPQGQSA
jgi:hypothetical protein